MPKLAPLWAIALLAGCGGESSDFFNIDCGVEVPGDAQLTFVKVEGGCGEIGQIAYADMDDEDLGCESPEITAESEDMCDVSIRCEGEVFEGQFYDITFLFDYTQLPIEGTGDLYVWEPETGEECTGLYDVTIE